MSAIRTFNIERDWNGMGCNIFAKKTVSLTEGVTVLAGCNGSGKTTFLKQLHQILKSEGTPVMMFDNLSDGGQNARQLAAFRHEWSALATSICGSEGENISMNIGNFAGRLGDFVRSAPAGKDVFVLLDAVDSGYSIDNVVELKELFDLIIRTETTRSVYIVVSANSYELARYEDCWDVNRCEYIKFKDYYEYREFVLASRKLKDSRKYKEKK